MPETPGVYRMLDKDGGALYVGKAKALRRRVSSYTQVQRLPERLKRMVALTAKMEFVHTATEAEALLLEANLIKTLKPRFNILLRDDKMFPSIHVRADHPFPVVEKFRGARKAGERYYGPFASAGDVNRTLKALQRVFLLRNCTDGTFSTRRRPCLQYFIKRCTAPCVGRVSEAEYAGQVADAVAFLEGQSEVLQERYREEMEGASAAMAYEAAARYRDRLRALMAVQARQSIHMKGLADADVLALARDLETGRVCVQLFVFRGGQNYGHHAYFPRFEGEVSDAALMAGVMAQFYANRPAPPLILVSHIPDEVDALAETLGVVAGQVVRCVRPQRGARREVLAFAMMNAQAALKRRAADVRSDVDQLAALAELFEMDDKPRRVEVYDNSHIAGSYMVGAMIVTGPDGFDRKAYRKFNIREASASDDYGMMREVMGRRFRKAADGSLKPGDYDWPDILLIDGGKGQLSAVMGVLEEIGVAGDVTIVAIAKGEDRNAGREQFFMPGREGFELPVGDSRLYYLQRIRDEAHRYAVHSHRVRRKNALKDSALDRIPGIGPKKKMALIRHFGSARAVREARLDDLLKAPGVSKHLAEAIVLHFREN